MKQSIWYCRVRKAPVELARSGNVAGRQQEQPAHCSNGVLLDHSFRCGCCRCRCLSCSRATLGATPPVSCTGPTCPSKPRP